MDKQNRIIIKTGVGADVAFTLVVLASYFATFSALSDAKILNIILMIVLGSTYIAIGVYGYRYCARSNQLWQQLLYFAVQATLGGVIVYLGKGVGFNAMILLPLAAHSVILLPQGWMVASNVVVLLVYLLTVIILNNAWDSIWSGLPTFLAGQVFIVFFTQTAVGEEKARGEVERLVNELAIANQRLREYASQVESLTLTKERNRLAREIHDGLGHYLTTIHMQIQAARVVMKTDVNRSEAALATAQNLTREALADVRQSVAALRVTEDEVLPLVDRIGNMVKSSEGTGISTELTVLGTPRNLMPQTQLTLFRAAQEGLNNSWKHAQASKIMIILDYNDANKVSLTIEDDGLGTDNTDGGFGLLGIKERVHLLNGEFYIHSEKGQGFKLRIEVPE